MVAPPCTYAYSPAPFGVLNSEAISVVCFLRVQVWLVIPVCCPASAAGTEQLRPRGSMITFSVGVLITVILLVGFGFLSTASTGWFFKYRKPHDTLPSPDKNN
jgi:hypothetical protein